MIIGALYFLFCMGCMGKLLTDDQEIIEMLPILGTISNEAYVVGCLIIGFAILPAIGAGLLWLVGEFLVEFLDDLLKPRPTPSPAERRAKEEAARIRGKEIGNNKWVQFAVGLVLFGIMYAVAAHFFPENVLLLRVAFFGGYIASVAQQLSEKVPEQAKNQ